MNKRPRSLESEHEVSVQQKSLTMSALCNLLSSAIHSSTSWEALRTNPDLLATLQVQALSSSKHLTNLEAESSLSSDVEIQERPMTDTEYKRELQGFEEYAFQHGNPPEFEDRQGFVAVENETKNFVGCSSCLVMRRQGNVRNDVSVAPWCFLTDLYVEPPFRRKGIGTRLLQELETRVKGMGVRVLWTYTAGFEGPSFYIKNGYQQFVVQNGWYLSGHPRLGFYKELDQPNERQSIPCLSDQQCPQELANAIRARRGNGRLLNLDRVLLHSPPFAKGWGTFFSIVRSELTVSGKLRELAILAVGHLNRALYECVQHEPVFFAEGGTLEQARALSSLSSFTDSNLFDESEQCTLALALDMTRNIEVRYSTMQRVRAVLPLQQVVELIGTIAAYNLVSRFLVATGVQVEVTDLVD